MFPRASLRSALGWVLPARWAGELLDFAPQAGDLFLGGETGRPFRLERSILLLERPLPLLGPEQPLAGRIVDQAHPPSFAAEAKARDLAEQRAVGGRLDRPVFASPEPKALERRIQVLAERIVDEVLPHSEAGIELPLLQVVALVGGHRDHQRRGHSLLPEEVRAPQRLLGNPERHEHVRADTLARVSLDVV